MDTTTLTVRHGAQVLGAFIDAATFESCINTVARWAEARQSRYLCFCNVHAVVEMQRNRGLEQALSEADMVLPDGMPVAWMLRRLGFSRQERINGPDFMHKYCEYAEKHGKSIYFYGSTSNTLAALKCWAALEFPDLKIAGSISPPFRDLTPEEDETVIRHINASGAGVLFVGLGCPKQEQWMAAHRDRIHAVMVGVGAAFDYHAGTLKRAPLWMQRTGLEWLYRLCCEPRRLWKRYLVTNTLFVAGALRQLVGYRLKT